MISKTQSHPVRTDRYVVLARSVFFLLAIVLSVFRFMDSDYPFGIFKLFLAFEICNFNDVKVVLFFPVKTQCCQQKTKWLTSVLCNT